MAWKPLFERKVYGTSSAAQMLGCCEKTVRRLCREGFIQAYQLPGRARTGRLVITRDSLLDAMRRLGIRLPPPDKPKEEFTTGEAALVLGISTRALRLLCNGQRIAYTQMPNSRKDRRIPRAALVAALQAAGRTVPAELEGSNG